MELTLALARINEFRLGCTGHQRRFVSLGYTVDKSNALSKESRDLGIKVSKTSRRAVLLGADYGETTADKEYIASPYHHFSNLNNTESVIHGYLKHNINTDSYLLVYHEIQNEKCIPSDEWVITYSDGTEIHTSQLSDEQKALFKPSTFKSSDPNKPHSTYSTVKIDNINYLIVKE